MVRVFDTIRGPVWRLIRGQGESFFENNLDMEVVQDESRNVCRWAGCRSRFRRMDCLCPANPVAVASEKVGYDFPGYGLGLFCASDRSFYTGAYERELALGFRDVDKPHLPVYHSLSQSIVIDDGQAGGKKRGL